MDGQLSSQQFDDLQMQCSPNKIPVASLKIDKLILNLNVYGKAKALGPATDEE